MQGFCWIFASSLAPIVPQIGLYGLKYKAFSIIQCTLSTTGNNKISKVPPSTSLKWTGELFLLSDFLILTVLDCALGVHSASNQHNERRYEFYWGYKSHVLVDCISGLPLYELTTPGNIADSSVAAEILAAADQTVSLKECTFLADKGYDVKSIYNTVKTVYEGETFIPLNPRGTKASKTLPAGNPVCEAGFAMHKDGKTTNNGRTRQKYCCPFRQSKSGVCPCSHKNWNNGKKNRGCTKYKTLPDDYRLSIDRSCLYFKRTYALRTECERYNSRFKSTGQEQL